MTSPTSASASELFDAALARLHAADPDRMHQVRLGAIIPARKVLGIARAPRISPTASAWHLGVVLVNDEGVWATNEIVRAREEIPRGFTSENQRRRAELAAAAHRGGFAEGEEVHVGWEQLDLAALDRGDECDPLVMAEGVPAVRWSASGSPRPLAGYLNERVDFIVNPPERA